VTTMTTSADPLIEAAQLAAIRDRIDAECARIADLRQELQRREEGVRKLTNEAYWYLARSWFLDTVEHDPVGGSPSEF
jgi:hypothetical protein